MKFRCRIYSALHRFSRRMGCSWYKECDNQITYDVADLSPEWQVTMFLDADYQELFSVQETNTLVSRWKYLMESKRSIHFGRTLFAKFFLYAPETQKFFFREREKVPIRPYDWQRYPLFKSHVRRVINGIDYTISLLHYPEELARHLNRMREVHHGYSNMKIIYGE
ncbi:unnamed protein product, partial [Candidula unifasciata]